MTVPLNESLRQVLEFELDKEINIIDIHCDAYQFDAQKPLFTEHSEDENTLTILNGSLLAKHSGTIYLDRVKVFGEDLNLDSHNQGYAVNLDIKKCWNPILDENGILLADYQGSLIGLRLDLFHTDNTELKKILLYVLFKAGFLTEDKVKQMILSMPKEDIIEGILNYQTRWVRERMDIINGCLKDYRLRLRNLDSERSNIENETLRLVREETIIKGRKSKSRDEYEKELNKIKSLPWIKELKLYSKSLVIITKPVIVEDINLGEYKIEMNEHCNVSVWNIVLEKKKVFEQNGSIIIQHMHVDGSGHVCVGNLRNIDRYLASGDLDLYFQAIWEILNSYFDEGPYITLKKFVKTLNWFKEHKDASYMTYDVADEIWGAHRNRDTE